MLGGTSRGLVNGGSTNEGLRLLVRETCSQRLAPVTTWVALPTIDLVWASLHPLLRDAQSRLPMIRRFGDTTTIQCNGPHSPLVPDFSRPAGYIVVGFPGDVEIMAQSRRAPLASPPAPELGTGAAAARPLLQLPTTCDPTGRYAAFLRAPGFHICPLIGFCAPQRWRKTPLAPHAFL